MLYFQRDVAVRLSRVMQTRGARRADCILHIPFVQKWLALWLLTIHVAYRVLNDREILGNAEGSFWISWGPESFLITLSYQIEKWRFLPLKRMREIPEALKCGAEVKI